MASPARPAAASVSGAFGLSPDPKRCSFDQALRREQDFQEKRLLMSFVNFHEQEKLSKKIVTEAIEDCMKKQADNLLQSLDVISGRLSQLELYCYKLERSIGELRSDVMDYHGEATLNFRCLEKNVKEVQKSVQVLQDKQELAETQKELSKLQIIHEDGQKSEGTAPSVLMTRDELALVPLHQRKNHEVAPIYVQSSSISVPMAEQPQQFHPVSNGSFGPQANKLAPCSVASYMVPGSAQTYNTAYGSPSSNPPTVVAVVNQQSQTSAPMMLHHLGPQAMQQHRVDMAERAARMGYSKDQAESIALRMVAAGHPTEFNTMHDRLSSVGNVVTPQAWSG
ncbi:hypothetical protein PR202_gb02107 [Eleusine coracana subsp. coracana]|uniref:DUF1421 domain-containing protein n=1 Tax=Eleusine coracana subsp. coracana TaxID=191504 RepID=A0AAV5DXD1_ELECO|nr:hypothetical protein PR202_gb02107 [Eleusine coracana subsp. coracana]